MVVFQGQIFAFLAATEDRAAARRTLLCTFCWNRTATSITDLYGLGSMTWTFCCRKNSVVYKEKHSFRYILIGKDTEGFGGGTAH